jgi:hypothetical protein
MKDRYFSINRPCGLNLLREQFYVTILTSSYSTYSIFICKNLFYVHSRIFRNSLCRECCDHRVHIFTRDETGLVCLPTQLERTLQLYW